MIDSAEEGGVNAASPSPLTSEYYWCKAYEKEFAGYRETGDEGEEWFQREVQAILKWLTRLETVTIQSSILDVGCGNGLFLVRLAQLGYKRLHGWDYAPEAIALGKELALKRGLKEFIHLSVRDLTASHHRESGSVDSNKLDSQVDGPSTLFDVVHDKGTFDVFFMAQRCSEYVNAIANIVLRGGVVAITSCNATSSELCDIFCCNDQFEKQDVLQHRSFTFGGISGQVVSSVAFRRL